MTEEQFDKMYAAALQGLLVAVQGMAIKQGAKPGTYNWVAVQDMLSNAAAVAAKPKPQTA